MTVELHFSLGPVQAFIAESRRTRDLWMGSYLLSYLAGRAMAAAARHGRVVLPNVDDPILRLYASDSADHEALPAHATFPNRFVIELAGVEAARAAGHAARQAVDDAWQRIADTVWAHYVKPVASQGLRTDEIWRRQVSSFWEVAWVVGGGPAALDRRKHWRDAVSPPEPGDHCTMMGRYQELSGYVRRQVREQQEFWNRLRQKLAGSPGEAVLDLREDERLCAVALIKRLLPKVSNRALGRKLDQDTVRWPSTLHLAAWPWIEKVCADAPADAVRYAEEAIAARASACGERTAAAPLVKEYPDAGKFPCLDGNFFFVRALRREQDTPLDDHSDQDRREPLARSLLELQKRVGSKASPFLGLLIMDGDRMGELLGKAGDPRTVTSGLSRFAERAPDIVSDHHGATVYAGGDDVLAFLPMDRALPAALALADAYAQCFAEAGLDEPLRPLATISGALLYAHYRLPLRRLLALAHELLEQEAKDRAGRASLAISLQRSSGETARWVVPWAYLRSATSTPLTPLIDHIREKHLGKSVLYQMRARLTRLSGADILGPGRSLDVATLIAGVNGAGASDALRDLMVAEIRDDRERGERTPEEIQNLAKALLAVCCHVRKQDDPPGYCAEPSRLSFDGATLAHFLATGGLDEEDE